MEGENNAESIVYRIKLRVYKACLLAEDMGDVFFDDVCVSFLTDGQLYIKPFGDESDVPTPSAVPVINPAAKTEAEPDLIPSAVLHLTLHKKGVKSAGIVSLRLSTANLTAGTSEICGEIRFFSRSTIPFDLNCGEDRAVITSWNDNLLRAVEQCCEAAEILRRIMKTH